jgi:hypothetical protein
VYGGSLERPLTEATPPRPISDYGRAKLDQEEALRAWAHARPTVSVLVGRLSNVYGPGQHLDKPQGLISHMSRCLIFGVPVHIFVPLDTIRDYLFAEDAGERIVAGLERLRRESPGGGRHVTKVLGSERETTVAALVGVFRRIAKRQLRVVAGPTPRGRSSRRGSSSGPRSGPTSRPLLATQLLDGVSRVHRHQLALFQAGRLPAPRRDPAVSFRCLVCHPEAGPISSTAPAGLLPRHALPGGLRAVPGCARSSSSFRCRGRGALLRRLPGARAEVAALRHAPLAHHVADLIRCARTARTCAARLRMRRRRLPRGGHGRGFRLLGYEPDAGQAARLGTARHPGPDVESPSLPTGECSTWSHCTWCSSTLTDPDAALANARHLLKPGGSLYLVVPHIDSFEARLFGGKWHNLDPPRHISFPLPEHVRQLADRHGYTSSAIDPCPSRTASRRACPWCLGTLPLPALRLLFPLGVAYSRLVPTGSHAYWLTRQ